MHSHTTNTVSHSLLKLIEYLENTTSHTKITHQNDNPKLVCYSKFTMDFLLLPLKFDKRFRKRLDYKSCLS